MSELVTFLVALPVLYGLGLFYYRLGGWLCRTLRRATRAAVASPRAASP